MFESDFMKIYSLNIFQFIFSDLFSACLVLCIKILDKNQGLHGWPPQASPISCANLQDLLAAPDALLSPESHNLLGAAASSTVVQPTQDPLTHRGHQQRWCGGATRALVQDCLRLHGQEQSQSWVLRLSIVLTVIVLTDCCCWQVTLKTLIWINLCSLTAMWEQKSHRHEFRVSLASG